MSEYPPPPPASPPPPPTPEGEGGWHGEVEAERYDASRERARTVDAGATPGRPSSDRIWAILCHVGGLVDFGVGMLLLGVLPPLLIWILKRDESPEVAWHGREALNFQITMLIASFAAGLLSLCVVGIPLLFALPVYETVLVIVAAVRCAEGARWRYPLTLRLVP